MGECLLQKNGVTVDSTAVTATESDVLIGKTYMKSNGDKGVGTKPDNGSPQKTLPLNGSIVLPSGYYGGGTVKSSVPTYNGETIVTGKNAVTVKTSGKYATGNIELKPIANLTSAVIKKGMYVAGIGPGTWEGYLNEDPNAPFFLGTLGPGWTSGKLAVIQPGGNWSIGSASIIKDAYWMHATAKSESVAIVFEKRVDFTKYNKVKITGQLIQGGQHLVMMITENLVTSYLAYQTGNGYTFRIDDFGERITKYVKLPASAAGDIEIDISDATNKSSLHYMYFYLEPNRYTNTDYEVELYKIILA